MLGVTFIVKMLLALIGSLLFCLVLLLIKRDQQPEQALLFYEKNQILGMQS